VRRFVIVFVVAFAVLGGGASTGRAASADSIYGSGGATVDGVRIQFVVDAASGATGDDATGRLAIGFFKPGDAPESLRVVVTCLRVSGNYAIVGGMVKAGSTGDEFTHVALLVYDNGPTGDTIETVRFIGFPTGFDPCAYADSIDDFLLFFPLDRGDVVVTDF
jgi:hypothetical protein